MHISQYRAPIELQLTGDAPVAPTFRTQTLGFGKLVLA
jgi:hypothetical protein